MWDRKVLKEKGKAAYRANRVTCIFAAFLLTVVSGGASVPTSTTSWQQTSEDLNIPPEVLKWIIAVLGGAFIVGFLLSVFVFNPVEVGLRQFFRQNAVNSKTGLSRDNIGLAFSSNYTNVVAAKFTTDLFIFLWTLCLIVPGIIKAYSWRMVPYIIAEDPEITGTEARERSAAMMDGSKWASFVLDLSFLGWILLGVLTLGILNLVFTNPYKAAADAELFRWLNGERDAPSAVQPEYMDEAEITAVPTPPAPTPTTMPEPAGDGEENDDVEFYVE